MTEQSHETATFSKLHHSRLYPSGSALQIGVAASRPGSPQGIGDLYYATDTQTLYSTNAAGTAWQVAGTNAVMVGDSGSGGTAGLVPAPGAGDYAAGYFLDAGGNWSAPAGGGSSTYVGAQASKITTNQTVNGSASAYILWNNDDWDDDGFHNPSSSTDVFVLPSSSEEGYYMFYANMGIYYNDGALVPIINLYYYDYSASTAYKIAEKRLYNAYGGGAWTTWVDIFGYHYAEASDYFYAQVDNTSSGDYVQVLINSKCGLYRVGV